MSVIDSDIMYVLVVEIEVPKVVVKNSHRRYEMDTQCVRGIRDKKLRVRYIYINFRIILKWISKWAMGNEDVRRIYLDQEKYQCRSLRT